MATLQRYKSALLWVLGMTVLSVAPVILRFIYSLATDPIVPAIAKELYRRAMVGRRGTSADEADEACFVKRD